MRGRLTPPRGELEAGRDPHADLKLFALALRFAPGLRIAIAAACAYARVPRAQFSALNLIAAFIWAALLLTLVSHVGPRALAHVGLSGIWGAIVPASLIVVFGWWLGRDLRERE